MTAASEVIGIEDVFEARIAVSGSAASAARKIVLLHGGVLDHRLDQEVGRDDAVGRLDAAEHLVRVRPALLGQLRQAAAHPLEASLDGARGGIVKRDAPSGGGDHLRDPRSHLARADDEDVLEASRAEARGPSQAPLDSAARNE